jgi:HEAT repeat protein
MSALSKSKLAKLLAELSSANRNKAEEAALSLDHMLYAGFGPGPRLVSAEEAESVMHAHQQMLRDSDVLEPLSDAVSKGGERTREYAATALGHLDDERAIPVLLQALIDPQPKVRRAGATSLGFLRATNAVPMLLQVLDDVTPEPSQAAAMALGHIRSPDAVPRLMTFYERGNRDAKIAALDALGLIADARSLQLVRDALSDKDRKVRKAAKSALANYDLKRRQ